MTERYKVTWTIDVWADSPKDAALKCLAIQRDVTSIATFFQMTNLETDEKTDVDLEDL